ncbi:hypothetical protein ACDA63_14415 [Uliginosibacterium sp. sgz301328]|uniref:hypothetical protein n=1 Tax=Uliginosibacterium sp. sgz301328 TaxID=3243764 RepID=UPI00359EE0A2
MGDSGSSIVAEATRRELIAFAFVEESYSKSGDIVGGLLPLFAPVLAKRANRIFDSVQFAADVQAAYDIPMSPLVANGLVDRMAEAGLLRIDDGDIRTYRVAPQSNVQRSDETGVDALLTEFCAFARSAIERVKLAASDEALQMGFLKRLTTAYFLSFVEKREKNYFKGHTISLKKVEDDEQDAVQLEQALDVICAEFALQKLDEGGVVSELLLRLVAGALIAEVVLTLQQPSSKQILSSLKVVFDGPLILDFMDLSTPELKDYAADLFSLVESASIRRVVFKHTVEEMKGTLQGPLKALQRGEEPFGPLGNRIRANSEHAAYARAMLDGLEEQLERIGFEILDADNYLSDEYTKFCSQAAEEHLRNDVGPLMFNLERRIRDAHSIATILRLRGSAQEHGSIAETGWILVTRNDAVANRSQSSLEARQLIERKQVPPAITDRRLAGYLWFAVGGSVGALTRKKLIANCSYVMTPRTDVVSKARQYLCELDPAKADTFVALMRDQRAQRCLMRSTLGFPSSIRPENAEELLREVRLSVAEDIKAEAAAREAELQASHQAELSALAQARLSDQLESQSMHLRMAHDREVERSLADGELKKRDERVDALTGRLSTLELALESGNGRRIQRAVRSAQSATQGLKILLTVVYLLVVGCAYWFLPSERSGYALAITVVVALLAFWIVPQYLYDRISRPLWMWRFRARCDDLGVTEYLAAYDIDPSLGRVVPRIPL